MSLFRFTLKETVAQGNGAKKIVPHTLAVSELIGQSYTELETFPSLQEGQHVSCEAMNPTVPLPMP